MVGELKTVKGAATAVAVAGFHQTRKTSLGNILKNIYAKFHDDRNNNECGMVEELKT